MSSEFRARSGNCLLVRDDVGRARPTCFDLPGDGFVYGNPAAGQDPEGAGEVAMRWQAHVPSPRSWPSGPDFSRINKAAAKGGVRSPRDLANFRRERCGDCKLSPPRQASSSAVLPSDVVPDYVYGRRARASTPVGMVVAHHYGRESEDALDAKYARQDFNRENASGNLKVQLNRSTQARIKNARISRAAAEAKTSPRFAGIGQKTL